MAQRTIIALEDDLDGSPAAETLRFGIDGSEYEIDLSEQNAARFRRRLAPFVSRARRTGRGPRRPRRTAASRRRSHDIRAWAEDQGIVLSERGRIPASVVARYEAAVRATPRRLRPAPELGASGRRLSRRFRRGGTCPAGVPVTAA
jgi:hypothetical protein